MFFNMKKNSQKVFLVFNTACIGDCLVCNSLCQNIKFNYPDSKVVFIVNKPFYDVARFQKDVDEVVVYDKKSEHHGFLGFLKFVKDFKYKNPYASFITYANIRNYLISLFVGARHIISDKHYSSDKTMQEEISSLISYLDNNKFKNFPISYIPPKDISSDLKPYFKEGGKYISLCTLTKNEAKNMPVETAIKLIKLFNNTEYEIIFTGVGEVARIYSQQLTKAGCRFIDLTDKTTLPELATILKKCDGSISVDTGTMHLTYAVGVPLVSVFYKKSMTKNWAPNEQMYKCTVIDEFQNAENIYNQAMNLFGGKSE